MPIYEYKCSDCDASLRKLQKFSDKPLKKCPECGKNTLVKQLSGANFVLKGSGWYVTDFKDKKGSTSQNTEATNNTSSTTKEGSSTTKESGSTAAESKPSASSSAKQTSKPTSATNA